ncbi:MAG TPA: nodulation protein NfeD, partial [Terriglobales bacterium]|nr:nodulation protein NfeD [Terriglobales bacterium]
MMRTRSAIYVFCFAMLIAIAPGARASEVLKLTVDGTINPITDEYIERGIARAQQDHADAVLIELSTPGGLMDSMRSTIQRILTSQVPVIVYVDPTGSRAASAGFFILESADVAAMAPGTNTGAAHPVLLYGKMDEVMKQKIENDAAAFLRSYVTKRDRNAELAETAVRQSKSFTDQEALNQHLIDLVAKDQNELFSSLNGRAVKRFDGSTATLHLVGDSVTSFEMTLKQQILNYLLDPNVSLILLVIGALAIY